MGIKFTNNAEGLLNANINDSVTTLTLQANQGDYFPVIVSGSGDYFYATLVDTSGNVEVIKVTERQDGTDVFQVMERAAEAFQNEAAPFTARSFVTNDKVQLRPTAASIPDIRVLTDDEFLMFGDGPDARVRSNGTSFVIQNGAGTESMLVATVNDAVKLYFNDNKKLETTDTGATLTGTLIADGLTLGDNEDVRLGAGPDAKISSNGTALVIENGAGTETMLTATQNGSVALYHNNII